MILQDPLIILVALLYYYIVNHFTRIVQYSVNLCVTNWKYNICDISTDTFLGSCRRRQCTEIAISLHFHQRNLFTHCQILLSNLSLYNATFYSIYKIQRFKMLTRSNNKTWIFIVFAPNHAFFIVFTWFTYYAIYHEFQRLHY